MYVYDCIDFESGDETMNITNSNQSMGFMPVSQSTQDSHEQNIQKQIINLQEKMRDITLRIHFFPKHPQVDSI